MKSRALKYVAGFFAFPLSASVCAAELSPFSRIEPASAQQNLIVTERQVIIDDVELIGDNSVSSAALAKSLGIEPGRSMPSEQSAELLAEAERKLRATGRYREDNLSVKLIRGASYPHYIVQIQVTRINPWYFGLEGGVGKQDDFDKRNGFFKQKSERAFLSVYTGSRDWNDSGYLLDFEVINLVSRYRLKYDYEDPFGYSQYNWEGKSAVSSFSTTILKNALFDKHLFFGGMGRLSHVSQLNGSKNETHMNYAAGHSDHAILSKDSTERSFSATAEAIGGFRVSKFKAAGIFDRTFTRDYWSRSNSDIEDLGSVGKIDYFGNSSDEVPQGYIKHDTIDILLDWSDKSGLSLLEPGLDLKYHWNRYRYENIWGLPSYKVLADYTFVMRDRYGFTLSLGEMWRFRESSFQNDQTKVARTYQIGVRGDWVTENRWVLFSELYRIGGYRRELQNTDSDGYLLDTRFALGVRYASTSMIYALSAAYGPVSLSDASTNFEGVNNVYKRIGVQ